MQSNDSLALKDSLEIMCNGSLIKYCEKNIIESRTANSLQSPELADECDTSEILPQVSLRVQRSRIDLSPLKQRLPISKRARKRRHSSTLSGQYTQEEPDFQMHQSMTRHHG